VKIPVQLRAQMQEAVALLPSRGVLRRSAANIGSSALASLCLIRLAAAAWSQILPVTFEDATESAGVASEHVHAEEPSLPFRQVAGGVAAGDINGNGYPDLYVIGGDGTRQYLFVNQGDGTFVEKGQEAEIAFAGETLAGPTFADIDGDGDLDLFIGTVGFAVGREPRLLRNDGRGIFTEIAQGSGMFPPGPYTNASFGDYDGDGLLDLLTTHWSMPLSFFALDHLWRNEGDNVFRGVTNDTSLTIATDFDLIEGGVQFGFTGNFADIDGDGWPDILLASDFGMSQVFRNLGNSSFTDITTHVIDDENGMGAAIGDYDNDGHLDWFVTSIYDPVGDPFGGWGDSGNRLYRNLGDGSFADVTEDAGVRDGAWGWGACFADFDNDGWLDIFHVNGWISPPLNQWLRTSARLFMNNRDGTFSEQAMQAGIDDRGDGRGVVCFDYDRDGDIDVFIANVNGPMRLYRNNLDGRTNFLQVKLVGRPPNTEAIGARVYLRPSTGPQQMRELRAGSNFVSQDPAVAHFGLGSLQDVAELEVVWPHGSGRTLLADVRANRHVVIRQVGGDVNCDGTARASDVGAWLLAASAGAMSAAPCPGGDLNYDGAIDHDDLAIVLANVFGRTTSPPNLP